MSIKDMIEDLTKLGDPSLAPGVARCPGRTVQEILSRDGSASDPALSTQRYEFLGDEELPCYRVCWRPVIWAAMPGPSMDLIQQQLSENQGLRLVRTTVF